MSEPLRRVAGRVAPLWRANVDTDAIIPIDYCINRRRPHFDEGLFRRWRIAADGAPIPSFPLNQERFRGAPVLVAAENFGCGSSREMAVWALHDSGFRCVIAPSFGEIFFNNCFQNGVLPLVLDASRAETLARRAETEGLEVEVDVEACVLRAGDDPPLSFSMNEWRRQTLLEGLDPIAATLALSDRITAFQTADRARRPWVYRDASR